jgi:hypothetical protein
MRNNKFIQQSIKKPGRVRRILKAKKGEPISKSKLEKKISEVKKRAPSADKKSELAALNLAKRFKTDKSKKGGLKKYK